jgi:branched-chain amino acid transport system ATP-binding protein
MTEPILVVDGMRRTFGGLTAVDVEHFEVPKGRITALIGPNGAGKTTFFNLVTGFDRPDAGRWTFDGRDVSRASAPRLARMGMVRTFQLTKVLPRMTVLENMLLAAPRQTGERFLGALLPGAWRGQEAENLEKARALLQRFGLEAKAGDWAGSMSGGQRKLLEMARALMVEPSLLMLDEPMAGVNPALVESLLGHVTSLRDEGRTVLFVEHDMDVVMSISDQVVCMAQGRVISEGTPDHVSNDPAVIDAYLGKSHGAPA